MIRFSRAALACVVLALGGAYAAGCGSDNKDSSSSDTPTQTLPAPDTAKTTAAKPTDTGGTSSSTKPVVVTMQGNMNSPGAITVKVGQKIDWENKDGYAHNVTSTDGEKIESGNFTDQFSYAPKKAGTIKYVCTIHSGQGGTITVTK
jgi:plastocyanin